MHELLKLDLVIVKLQVNFPNEKCALLPFSAKVNILEYQVYAFNIQPEDFHSLDIVANDLSVRFDVGYDDEWDKLLISFLNRVERLRLSIDCRFDQGDDAPFEFGHVAPVAEALIRAIAPIRS